MQPIYYFLTSPWCPEPRLASVLGEYERQCLHLAGCTMGGSPSSLQVSIQLLDFDSVWHEDHACETVVAVVAEFADCLSEEVRGD